jgi:CTLH/CRA C-terminal to LisH motif domain
MTLINLVTLSDIRTAIIAGDIDCAIKLTQAHFPQVLVNDDLMLFRLKKRKFIEMLRLANDNCNHSFCDTAFNYGFQPLTATVEEIESAHPHDLSIEKSSPTVFGTPRKLSVPVASISTPPASDIPQPTRRVSYASITATPSSASPPHGSYFDGRSLDESLDEPISPTSNFSHTRRRRRSSSHISFTSLSSFEEDDDDIKSDMREAIRFGHLLQEQYGRDQRTMVKSGMADIHSLINEVETYHSLCAAVKALDTAGRDALASELNTAILGKWGYLICLLA